MRPGRPSNVTARSRSTLGSTLLTGGREGRRVPIELVEWSIGPVRLVSVPGEAFHELGRSIEARNGEGHVLLAGLAPEWHGYLPSPFTDGYEESMSYGPSCRGHHRRRPERMTGRTGPGPDDQRHARAVRSEQRSRHDPRRHRARWRGDHRGTALGRRRRAGQRRGGRGARPRRPRRGDVQPDHAGLPRAVHAAGHRRARHLAHLRGRRDVPPAAARVGRPDPVAVVRALPAQPRPPAPARARAPRSSGCIATKRCGATCPARGPSCSWPP